MRGFFLNLRKSGTFVFYLTAPIFRDKFHFIFSKAQKVNQITLKTVFIYVLTYTMLHS